MERLRGQRVEEPSQRGWRAITREDGRANTKGRKRYSYVGRGKKQQLKKENRALERERERQRAVFTFG
jgi:hypothetical protein